MNHNVYGINSDPNKTIIISTETTRRPSWGPPDTRSACSRSVNPQVFHGDVVFLAFPTFLVMFQGEVRS